MKIANSVDIVYRFIKIGKHRYDVSEIQILAGGVLVRGALIKLSREQLKAIEEFIK
jgi:hypothetical protein